MSNRPHQLRKIRQIIIDRHLSNLDQEQQRDLDQRYQQWLRSPECYMFQLAQNIDADLLDFILLEAKKNNITRIKINDQDRIYYK